MSLTVTLLKVITPPPGDKHQPVAQYPLPTSKALGKMAFPEYEVEEEAATVFF